MKKLLIGAAVGVVAIVPAGGAVASNLTHAKKPAKVTTVNVTAKEYKFVLSRKSVPVGKVTFIVSNKGTIPHNMAFQGPILYAQTPLIAAGKKTKLTVTFKKPGEYTFVCTPHFELGMVAKIKVTKK
jgi:plastocyanin